MLLLPHPSTTPVVIQNVKNKYIINSNNHSSMLPNGVGGQTSQAGDSSGPNNNNQNQFHSSQLRRPASSH